MSDMKGFIVKHQGFGVGKIESTQFHRFSVQFFFPIQKIELAQQNSGLKRAILTSGTLCKIETGWCRIENIIPADLKTEPNLYTVELESGLSQEIKETEILHLESIPALTSPLEVLSERQLEGYGLFLKREALVEALDSSIRGALGLRALLSSRIDLRSHQAYVAGTVLMDRIPRYLLADEVGLGKTIEAGIVIHDLLERKPSAKILILCPETLTQQWLCELYSKFSGRVFDLLELRSHELLMGGELDKVIVSFREAIIHDFSLLNTKWDLVVVDETHHLLPSANLYNLTQKLSLISPGLLLLSAVPAQHREDEYLRLLALLEPERYNVNSAEARKHFKALYERQIELGRKLSYISRRLLDLSNGEGNVDRILNKLSELISFPVLKENEALSEAVQILDPSSKNDFIEDTNMLLHQIGDRYRISRRILRNRRSQLFENQPDLRIDRHLNRLPYSPDQLELDAGNVVRRLLQGLSEDGVCEGILVPFAKEFFQSLCSPLCFQRFAELVDSAQSEGLDSVELDNQVSYKSWTGYASNLWGKVKSNLSTETLQDLRQVSTAWMSNDVDSGRVQALLDFLGDQHKKFPQKTFIIFAGFYGLAKDLFDYINHEFGQTSVARFTWDMESKSKEKSVTRFKRDSECWIMVSDETGGEGRNFQYVDEIVHFDIPWSVSTVEQRIGRLDRLGRKDAKVYSNVLHARGNEEDGFLGCLDSGFEVFTHSISGLEFALSKLERRITQVAVDEGYDGLDGMVSEVKDCVEGERAEDDVQGMLDAASHDRKSAEVFRRAQSTPERDFALETAFCDWLKFIAGNGSLRFTRAADYPDGIIEFRPNQIPPGLVNVVTSADGNVADRFGTFRREIAQERPDLEFFSVGNEFFDSVCKALEESTKGRSYAIECESNCPPWRGFEFSYRPVGKYDELQKYPGLSKHLDRIFAVRVGHFFIQENMEPVENGLELLRLRRSLANGDKNRTWNNFTLNNTKVQLLAEYYATQGWESLVKRSESIARLKAKEHFKGILIPVLKDELARINEQMRQAKVSKADDREDEDEGSLALVNAIHGWDLELDIAGFLSVNGGIIG